MPTTNTSIDVQSIKTLAFMAPMTHKTFRAVLQELPPDMQVNLGMAAGYVDIATPAEFQDEAYMAELNRKLYAGAAERKNNAKASYERALCQSHDATKEGYTLEQMLTKEVDGMRITEKTGITKTMREALLAATELVTIDSEVLREARRKKLGKAAIEEIRKTRNKVSERIQTILDEAVIEADTLADAVRHSPNKPLNLTYSMHHIINSYKLYRQALAYYQNFVPVQDRTVRKMYLLKTTPGVAVILNGNEHGMYWFLGEKNGDIEPRIDLIITPEDAAELRRMQEEEKKEKQQRAAERGQRGRGRPKKSAFIEERKPGDKTLEKLMSLEPILNEGDFPDEIDVNYLMDALGFTAVTAQALFNAPGFPLIPESLPPCITRADFINWSKETIQAMREDRLDWE